MTYFSEMLQFTVFADILTQLPLPFLWLNIHYISLFIIHQAYSIITITAVVNSVCQMKPSFSKYRFHICVALCCILGVISMISTVQGARSFMKAIKRSLCLVFLVVNVFTLCGIIFIYGVKTLKHDILFIFGHTLTPIFWFSITLLPIIFLVNTNHQTDFIFAINVYL